VKHAARSSQSGITLMEMLIVITIIAVMVGVAFPSIASGVETLRLRSASDLIVSGMNSALNRAERWQMPVEMRIERGNNRILFATVAPGYAREVTMPEGVTIERVLPVIPNLNENLPRHFLIHPGGTVPRIGIELKNRKNTRRLVSIDPITGVAQVAEVMP